MLLVEVAVEVGIETSEWTETGLPKSLDERAWMRLLLGNWRIDFVSLSLCYECLEDVTMCP